MGRNMQKAGCRPAFMYLIRVVIGAVLALIIGVFIYRWFLGGMTGLFSPSATLELPTSQPQPADSGRTMPLVISDYLTALEQDAAVYAKATTTLQKDEIRKRIQTAASELLRNAQITLQATVTDVTVPREGVATIRFQDLSLDPFATHKDTQLAVTATDRIDLAMPRAQALGIQPGMQIEIIGHPVFKPKSGDIFLDNLPSASLLTISLRNVYPPLGTISIPHARIHLAPAKTKQPQDKP